MDIAGGFSLLPQGRSPDRSVLVPLPVGQEDLNPAAGSHRSDGRGPRQHYGTTGPVSERCISWSAVFAGTSPTGIAVFSRLDEGNTRVSARFAWPPSALGLDLNGTELAEDLLRFKDFVECLPNAPETDRAGNGL